MAAKPDLTEFFKLSKPKNPPCQIKLIFGGQTSPKIDREELAQLRAAMDTDKGVITTAAVRDWLAERGHEVSVSRIATCRGKKCDCGRA